MSKDAIDLNEPTTLHVIDDRGVAVFESVLVPRAQYQRLKLIEDRAEMKLTQLEALDLDEFGGPGTGEDVANRPAYIKLLKWLLNKGF